jgi:hypothetical protein
MFKRTIRKRLQLRLDAINGFEKSVTEDEPYEWKLSARSRRTELLAIAKDFGIALEDDDARSE